MAITLPHIQTRQLFAGPLISLRDCDCHSPMGPCASEESTPAHQVVFTRTGVFVKHTGRCSVVGEPTQALFFNRDETYRVSHPAQGGDKCTVMSVDGKLLADVLLLYNEDASDGQKVCFAPSHVRLNPALILAHHKLRRLCRQSDFDVMHVEEIAIALLGATIDTAYRHTGISPTRARADTLKSRRELAERTKLTICASPAASHSLSSLAKALNSSPFHLARTFSAEVGLPIHQYLVRLRLVLALERLADGCTNLSALALDLGFASHSHFSRVFGRVFGRSPSSFRRNLRGTAFRNLRKNLIVAA